MSKADNGGYDEVNEIATVVFNACSPMEPSGIGITIAEAWDDTAPRRHILVECSGGLAGIRFNMSADKAEALGILLTAAAREMRRMATAIDEENE